LKEYAALEKELTTEMTNKQFRWLHLSDFHVGKDEYGQSCLFKYILHNVQQAISDGKPPHAVFITGDIANSGKESEYETFLMDFLWPLQDLLTNTPSADRIFVVPGNHDVTRSQARAIRTRDLLSHIPTFLDPTVDAQFERTTLLPRFKAFIDNDSTTGGAQSHWISSAAGSLTRRLLFGAHKIGVLCLNSAWLSSEGEDRHFLSPGKGILEKGLEELEDTEIVFVLAHHPIDWFVDEEVSSIVSLLSMRPVVYLCGHLHKSGSTSQSLGMRTILSIQAGAAFQAREDEQWVNRIVWGELNLEDLAARLIPFMWSRDYQEWSIDTNAFPNELRVKGEDFWQLKLPALRVATTVCGAPGVEATSGMKLPLGWISLDRRRLEGFSRVLSDDDVIGFFNGRLPTFSYALSPKIPRRPIVSELVRQISRQKHSPSVALFLLKGAGGEGKSTVLLQVVCDLLRTDVVKRVLWNESAEGVVPNIDQLIDTNELCLIASDNAEGIAKKVFQLTRIASKRHEANICILLACRDTDWIAVKCDQLPWRIYASVIDIPLRGLSRGDATLIVEAWERYGERGLGRLYGRSREEAIEALIEEATREAYSEEGAFLGAMLRTRMGDGLRAHVKRLLVNLSDSDIPFGTLRDAFAYIATPHSENVLTLSRGPLAKALGCKRSELKKKVLGPLGEEAVVATSGLFVLTRHRAIAETAVDILSCEFHVDTDEILLHLMEEALRLANVGVFVPNLASWRFLSNHFLKLGKQELAVRLAQAAHNLDKENPFFIVQLAKMLRISGQVETSVELFHNTPENVRRDRTFYFEWGMSEGVAGNRCNSICLAAASLADKTYKSWPSTDDASRAFAGMGTTFARLYELFEDRCFIEACGATALLGSSMRHDPSSSEYFDEAADLARDAAVDNVPMPQAFMRLKAGILAAWDRRETEIPWRLPTVPEFTYSRLCNLLQLPEEVGVAGVQ
jgi:hypothetical protein